MGGWFGRVVCKSDQIFLLLPLQSTPIYSGGQEGISEERPFVSVASSHTLSPCLPASLEGTLFLFFGKCFRLEISVFFGTTLHIIVAHV